MDTDRIPGLTIAERAEELGLTYLEQRDLEAAEPWVHDWSARYGRGAHNLRAWLAAGRPAAERDRLCVSGRPSMVRAIRDLVHKLPEAVAWHLVQTTAIACVSPGLGLTGPWPLPPPNPTTRIDITFTEPALVAHEIAHSWQRDPTMWLGLTTAKIEELSEGIATLVDSGEIDGDAMDERADLHELAADSLATAWGFPVDSRHLNEARRRLRARDIGGTP